MNHAQCYDGSGAFSVEAYDRRSSKAFFEDIQAIVGKRGGSKDFAEEFSGFLDENDAMSNSVDSDAKLEQSPNKKKPKNRRTSTFLRLWRRKGSSRNIS